ncbi:MAG TPA: ABC transporter permease [Dongiaceae bacterium]|jgi:His/Glu/Gln/Arg/opine family amino acid ABC transporter permease subunit
MFDFKGYGHFLIDGTIMTVTVAIVSMAGAILLGLLGASAKLSKNRIARELGRAYTTIIRGVPDLVLLLLMFYGGTVLVQWLACLSGNPGQADINAFVTGSVVLSFIYGAYATEAFRGAFLAVPKGQMEAAKACGMSRWLAFRRIELPQVWRFALPSLGNVWLVLLKGTAIISVVNLEELTRKAQLMNGPLKMPFSIYFVAALIYLGLTALSEIGLREASKRASAGVQAA